MKPEIGQLITRRTIVPALKAGVGISLAVLGGVSVDRYRNNDEEPRDVSIQQTVEELNYPAIELSLELSRGILTESPGYELEEGIAAIIEEEKRVKQEDFEKAQEALKVAATEAARPHAENQAVLSANKRDETKKAVAQFSIKPVNGANMGAKITGYYCEYDSGFKGDGGGYCGAMSNGEKAHEGAVACGSNWTLGTTIYIENLDRTVVCKDRGLLAPNQIDVFSYYSSGLITTQTSVVKVVEE